jgi:hypothetical protein
MAEHQDFGLEPNPRFEANSDRVQENAITSDHQDRSLAAIRSQAMQDEVFSRDNRHAVTGLRAVDPAAPALDLAAPAL